MFFNSCVNSCVSFAHFGLFFYISYHINLSCVAYEIIRFLDKFKYNNLFRTKHFSVY